MFIRSLSQISEERQQILISVIIGLFGGFFTLGIPFLVKDTVWGRFWGPACQFNTTLCQHGFIFPLFDISACILIIGCLVISAILVCTQRSVMKNWKSAGKAGALAGASSAFVILILYTTSALFFPLFYIHQSFIMYWFITLILSIIIQAFFSCIFFVWLNWSSSREKETSHLPISSGLIIKLLIVYLVVAILILTIPALVTNQEIQKGNIRYSSYNCCGQGSDDINIVRLDSDSIALTQKTQNNGIRDYRNFGWKIYPYYRLYINGKEISNLSIIQHQGLPDTIDPPGGFEYGVGSKAVLSGPDFISNATSPNWLSIETVFDERNSSVFLDYKI